ncbi:MAG TPA: DNA-binding protein [Actinobacteria bacterium]|nr:DNA-binding protein [Actinomycetota bacterium]
MPSAVHQAREALGTRLRELRRDAGLTGRDLANLAGWHSSKVSRIEYGKQNPSENDIRAWCLHTRTEDQVPDLIASLRGIEALWVEWRKQLALGTRRRQKISITLAEQTRVFRAYDPTVIYGMLQTAQYAREIMSLGVNFHQIKDDLDGGVAARMERQRFLYEGSRRYLVLLGEQALRTNIGGREVMAGQLDRLLAVTGLPNVSLGIIPAAARMPLAPENAFLIFDDRMVMVETYSAELTITQPREVAVYAKAFSWLSQAAVYHQWARALIRAALDELLR